MWWWVPPHLPATTIRINTHGHPTMVPTKYANTQIRARRTSRRASTLLSQRPGTSTTRSELFIEVMKQQPMDIWNELIKHAEANKHQGQARSTTQTELDR
eukprot:GEZU01027055.1.p2 GENE.GEZU01027055.1~~GEZU01027055.1.p2  ORF type:complete len:100 (+),score=11.18 GEZU01027055.1:2-301(+)